MVTFAWLIFGSDRNLFEMQILLSYNLLGEINYWEVLLRENEKMTQDSTSCWFKSDVQEGVVLPESCGFRVTGDHTEELMEGTVLCEERPS